MGRRGGGATVQCDGPGADDRRTIARRTAPSHPRPSDRYSLLNATTGSTRVARRRHCHRNRSGHNEHAGNDHEGRRDRAASLQRGTMRSPEPTPAAASSPRTVPRATTLPAPDSTRPITLTGVAPERNAHTELAGPLLHGIREHTKDTDHRKQQARALQTCRRGRHETNIVPSLRRRRPRVS